MKSETTSRKYVTWSLLDLSSCWYRWATTDQIIHVRLLSISSTTFGYCSQQCSKCCWTTPPSRNYNRASPRLVENIELSPHMFSHLFYYVLCKLIFDDRTALTFPFSPVFVWYCRDISNYLSCLAKKGGLLLSITLFRTNLSDFESIVLWILYSHLIDLHLVCLAIPGHRVCIVSHSLLRPFALEAC